LDADHTLLVVDAGVSERRVAQTRVWSETRSFSDPCWSEAPSCSDLCLTWNAELLRLALDGTRSYSDSCWMDAELLRSAF